MKIALQRQLHLLVLHPPLFGVFRRRILNSGGGEGSPIFVLQLFVNFPNPCVNNYTCQRNNSVKHVKHYIITTDLPAR